jgi:hypothetical protein
MQGDVKANSKPVARVWLYNIIKSQISSTKFQINLKSQYSTRGASACAARDQNIRQNCSAPRCKIRWAGDDAVGRYCRGSICLRFLNLGNWNLFEPALARIIWANESYFSSIRFSVTSMISLKSVWARDLVFGAWNFHDFCLEGNFRKIIHISP